LRLVLQPAPMDCDHELHLFWCAFFVNGSPFPSIYYIHKPAPLQPSAFGTNKASCKGVEKGRGKGEGNSQI